MTGIGRARDGTAGSAVGRRRFWMVLLVALIAATGIRMFDIKPAVAQSQVLTAWHSTVDPGLDPDSAVWDEVPSTFVQLTAQNLTPPMSDRGTPWVQVTALHYDDVLYVNFRWVDQTVDRTTNTVGVFSDAVAIQFPAVAATSVPAICMGQADSAVNIWHWRADSQAGIATFPERGYVDLYPQVDELHYPAAAALNPMVSAPAVQNLVAGGFGTLLPLESQVISGVGSYGDNSWSVTMARPFAAPGELQPEFRVGRMMDVAFALWNGANKDRNGQKSVSAFVRMEIYQSAYQGAVPESGPASSSTAITMVAIAVAVAVFVGAFAAIGRVRDDDDDQREAPSA